MKGLYAKKKEGIPLLEAKAAYRLRNESESILKIALEGGFNSLRSFNRNFKEIKHLSPSEYRKNTRKDEK